MFNKEGNLDKLNTLILKNNLVHGTHKTTVVDARNALSFKKRNEPHWPTIGHFRTHTSARHVREVTERKILASVLPNA